MPEIDTTQAFVSVNVPQPSVFITSYHDLECCEYSTLHRHPFYQIIWSGAENVSLLCDFHEYKMPAHSMACVGPGQVHHILTEDLTALTNVAFIGFTLDHIATYGKVRQVVSDLPFNDPLRNPLLNFDDHNHHVISNLFATISKRFGRKCTDQADILLAYLNVILVELEQLHAPIDTGRQLDAATQLTRDFQQLVETHFQDRLKVQDYAEKLGVTANHLVETVRLSRGQTPKQILQERLLLEAKRLLVHTRGTVAEISMQLSFKTPTYFGSWFKNLEGSTPSQFRQVG